jgi:hypothetical protein
VSFVLHGVAIHDDCDYSVRIGDRIGVKRKYADPSVDGAVLASYLNILRIVSSII